MLAHQGTHVLQFATWGEIIALFKGGCARVQEAFGGDPYVLPSPFACGRTFGNHSVEQ